MEETNVQFLGKRNCWKGIEKSNVPLITLSFNPEAGVFNIVRFLFTYLQTFDTILETGL